MAILARSHLHSDPSGRGEKKVGEQTLRYGSYSTEQMLRVYTSVAVWRLKLRVCGVCGGRGAGGGIGMGLGRWYWYPRPLPYLFVPGEDENG